MQEMGSNAVRTCHYPNDERFLDLCDERDMVVWKENHARGFGLERMQNPNFERQCADCKVTEEEWFKTRPRCYNNKGVLDEYRRPKEAFDVVKEMFPAMRVEKQN